MTFAKRSLQLALVAAAAALLETQPPLALANGGTPVTRLAVPDRGFYSKQTSYAGVPVKAHASVPDEALVVAGRERLSIMLGNAVQIASNLRREGVELHIIGAPAGDVRPRATLRCTISPPPPASSA